MLAGNVIQAAQPKTTRLSETLRVSPAGRYAYKNAPKCGCATIKRALWLAEIASRNPNAGFEVVEDFLHDVGYPTPFINDETAIGNSFVFTFVRNPYQRIYSAYLDKCVYMGRVDPDYVLEPLRRDLGVGEKPVSFTAFLSYVRERTDDERDLHWRSLYRATAEDLLRSHYIGAIESFDKDFAEVFSILFPDKKPQIIVKNSRRAATEGTPLPTRFELDIIADVFERDFAFYGYSFDPALSHEPPRRPRWQFGVTKTRRLPAQPLYTPPLLSDPPSPCEDPRAIAAATRAPHMEIALLSIQRDLLGYWR